MFISSHNPLLKYFFVFFIVLIDLRMRGRRGGLAGKGRIGVRFRVLWFFREEERAMWAKDIRYGFFGWWKTYGRRGMMGRWSRRKEGEEEKSVRNGKGRAV